MIFKLISNSSRTSLSRKNISIQNIVLSERASKNKKVKGGKNLLFPSTVIFYDYLLWLPSMVAFYCFSTVALVLSEIQSPINSRAVGEIVSSILAYSDGDPV